MGIHIHPFIEGVSPDGSVQLLSKNIFISRGSRLYSLIGDVCNDEGGCSHTKTAYRLEVEGVLDQINFLEQRHPEEAKRFLDEALKVGLRIPVPGRAGSFGGLPPDVSRELREKFEYGEGGLPNWLLLEDLEEVSRRYDLLPDSGPNDGPKSDFGGVIAKMKEAKERGFEPRFVFWFR